MTGFSRLYCSCISKVRIRTEQMRNVDLSQRSWRDSLSPQRKLWVNRREDTEPAKRAPCFLLLLGTLGTFLMREPIKLQSHGFLAARPKPCPFKTIYEMGSRFFIQRVGSRE